MLFPLYNAIQSLDPNQIEAARDLGAPWWRTHWRMVIPHAKPGIAVGLRHGVHAVGRLDPSCRAAGLARHPLVHRDHPAVVLRGRRTGTQGSAYAFLLLLLCTVFVRLMMRLFKVGLADIAK